MAGSERDLSCTARTASRGLGHDGGVSTTTSPTRRVHPAWTVAAVTFATLLAAGAFRSVPATLIDPISAEFGWSTASISAAVSVNLVLYGLIAPFAAALMQRFGVQRVVAVALLLVAAGSAGSAFVEARWQLVATWGVLVGLGTGAMAMSLAATVVGRWFVLRRGLVTGLLAAAASAGQLVFLPLVARLAQAHGWRTPCLVIAAVALVVVPLVVLRLHEFPAARGVLPYGGTSAVDVPVRPLGALGALRVAVRSRAFWFLALGFAICGASTNGLIGTHFVSAAHDHGMPATTAASLLALVGLFDVAGTIASGWLTDRVDPGSCCWPTTRCAGCRCCCCRACSRRGCSRRRGCSWCSTDSTGSPPYRRRSRWRASTSATRVRSSSAGSSPPTSSARRSWPSSPVWCATRPVTTAARSWSAGRCA